MGPYAITPEAFARDLTEKILTTLSTVLTNEDIQQLEDAIASYARRYSIIVAERAAEETDPGRPV